jgi:uncharacterized membrane protein (DUF2068 family)
MSLLEPAGLDPRTIKEMASVEVQPANRVKGTPMLLAIAVFKLVKALTLIALGIAAIKLLHQDTATTVARWLEVVHVDPDNHLIHGLLAQVLAIKPEELKAASVGTFLYAALLLTEGTGLILRKRWGEYLTIVATALLIPLELYEINLRVTTAKIVILAINIVIVAYLVWEVRRSGLAVHGQEFPDVRVR